MGSGQEQGREPLTKSMGSYLSGPRRKTDGSCYTRPEIHNKHIFLTPLLSGKVGGGEWDLVIGVPESFGAVTLPVRLAAPMSCVL